MKKLIIHIGTEKTGTTSIQSFLNENRDSLLRDHGVCYPSFGNSIMGHFELVASLHPMCNNGRRAEFAQHVDYDPEIVWNEFCKDILSLDCETVVVSSEHFSSRINSDGIRYVKKKLDERLPDYKVEIFVYLRNQVDMFQSAYSTYIKTGGTKSIFELSEGINGDGAYYNFYKLISMWSDVFGYEALTVRNFDSVKSGVGLVSDFLTCLDIDFHIKRRSEEKNITWNPMFLEFARNLNLGSLSEKEYGYRLDIYNRILDNYDYFNKFNGMSVLPVEVSRKIEETFLESNIELNKLVNRQGGSFFSNHVSDKEVYDYSNFPVDVSGLLYSGLELN